MDFREQLRRRRKDNRWIAGSLFVLLIVFTGIYYLVQHSRDLPVVLLNNRVLLFVLWYINVVLILAVFFVLARNLFKLFVERYHRFLGSRFKIKLVFTYIGLSLVPTMLLFVYATELLQGGVDRWFNTPAVKQVLEQGHAVAEAMNDRIVAANRRDAGWVLREISGMDLADIHRRPELARKLRAFRENLALDVLEVYENGEFLHGVVNSQSGLTDLPEPGSGLLRDAMENETATRVLNISGNRGRMILTAVASKGGGGPPLEVVAGTLLGPQLAHQSEQLIDAYQGYRQLEMQKGEIKASYLLTFLMVTLLILLFSSWAGLYLAKRVTVPIQALADGTRRISSGDLDHPVEVAADDELGVLVDSFNTMTAELKRSRELLEMSNQRLTATNERLAEERALIAAVLENVAAGVVSIDRDGKILTFNGAALQMLRQRETAVLGRPVGEVWADPERAKLAALFAEPASPGARTTREARLLLGGEWKTFETKITAMGEGDRLSAKVMVLEDLTELIKAQQLAAWSEAARRIAHEIKNPLTPIRLATERLVRKAEQGDPNLAAEVASSVDLIGSEVETMKALVDEFSRFARMPAPRLHEVDLRDLVKEIVHLYSGIKEGVAVSADVEFQASNVWVDGEQIKRALINLLDNAIEATSAPGQVDLKVARRDGKVEIVVADTGSGIPLEDKKKLFLPYFSTKGRGTGLGLAIVHRIVADHGGTIRVEDNSPHGTVFTVELPAT